jgi:hypothetical protein
MRDGLGMSCCRPETHLSKRQVDELSQRAAVQQLNHLLAFVLLTFAGRDSGSRQNTLSFATLVPS